MLLLVSCAFLLSSVITCGCQDGSYTSNGETGEQGLSKDDMSNTGNVTEKKENENENAISCECVPFHLCQNDTGNYGEKLIDIRWKETKTCSHYLQTCCIIDDIQPSATPSPSPTPSHEPQQQACGTRNINGVEFKITGAENNEAAYGELPWMVAILRDDPVEVGKRDMECGGSIIHRQVVLTGAHCVKGRKGLTVRAGEWDTQTSNEPYPIQEIGVEKYMVHENYYAGGLHNDIALLVLKSPLELNSVVDTICLPNKEEDMDGNNCIVSGWGTSNFEKKGEYQVILKKVELPIVPLDPCQAALRKTRLGLHFKLHPSFLCAGGEPGKDACKGDGGGPLVCPSKSHGRYVQAGIVSWGVGCGTKTPAIYANVPYLRSWIDNKMRLLKLA